ncbi:hypothetical protein SKAU_G00175280 [Synaphobranchus kaupii]|uniref:Uncharacterized protein n=1 Tax=Synaphobranchus kaupii TaxID=118154 RepID=A0A9Q1FLI9_SYNKA|nr:hypothetical protein SKAU_G00175280 [Synaphobranchus kaupii]
MLTGVPFHRPVGIPQTELLARNQVFVMSHQVTRDPGVKRKTGAQGALVEAVGPWHTAGLTRRCHDALPTAAPPVPAGGSQEKKRRAASVSVSPQKAAAKPRAAGKLSQSPSPIALLATSPVCFPHPPSSRQEGNAPLHAARRRTLNV